MKKEKYNTQRQSNIELLRVFAVLGVLVLHYNNTDIGGGMRYVTPGSINQFALVFLESIAICAVDLFFMISGYFMATSYKRTIRRPIELIIQVMLYSCAGYVLLTAFSHGNISFKSLIGSLIPANYFVIFYCVIYFISPYLNRLLDLLDNKQTKRLMIILITTFSFYCTFVQILCNIKGYQIVGLDSIGLNGSQKGYNIVNFTMMYLIGASIRKYKLQKRYAKRKLIGSYTLSVFLIYIWSMIDVRFPNIFSNNAWIYCNPLIVFEAATLLLIFLNIDLGSNRVINTLAKSVFSVFLLHGHFINHIGIQKYVQNDLILMIIHIIVSVLAIYCLCSIIHHLYSAITTPIFNKLFQKRNPTIVDLEINNES